ncbi:Cnl2/NKP2 family protein-domain-containing protein [Xylariaceae sp. FL0255]|nr:Cnl2/NKP2 family protein-domain-containing protein [Xylariaceae sp. FL0255]
MAPNEAAILRNYLLLPSRLPSIISLQEFTALFPKSLQSSPQIRTLYRDIQQQRNALVDAVSANIDAEAKRAKALRRTMVRTKKEGEQEEPDDEIEIERALFGPTSATLPPKQHSLQSIIPAIDGAIDELNSELKLLDDEESALLDSIKQVAGSLSDLRYGRLSNSKLTSEILDGLHSIQQTCEQKT